MPVPITLAVCHPTFILVYCLQNSEVSQSFGVHALYGLWNLSRDSAEKFDFPRMAWPTSSYSGKEPALILSTTPSPILRAKNVPISTFAR